MTLEQFATRCRSFYPALSRSFWLSSIFVLIVIVILLFMPIANASPIVVDDAFDFQTGPLGWTPTPVGKNGQLPPSTGGMQWTYGANEWSVNWAPVAGPKVATGNYLTSPSMKGSEQAGGQKLDTIRISLSHKFNFSSSNGVPPAAGQVAYSINGGAWTGLTIEQFSAGLVTTPDPLFGASPLIGPPSLVGQNALVAPSFVPPTGTYGDLFPLINGGASFVGSTPGYSGTGGIFVPSVAIIKIPETLINDFQLRLINANLGSNCEADAGWDVKFVQVDFHAPEPSGFVLAGLGAAGLAAAYATRRLVSTSPPSRA